MILFGVVGQILREDGVQGFARGGWDVFGGFCGYAGLGRKRDEDGG